MGRQVIRISMSVSTSKKHIFIVLGPTCSGKTSTALDLCKRFNGEIISADSRQVFKYMDIGTGKVPIGSNIDMEKRDGVWEMGGIKIWGYDLVEPDQFFSGYDFAKFSLSKAKELLSSGKNIFLVGGTGFYIDLFTGDVKPSNVIPDEELRKSLESLTLQELQEKLHDLDEIVFEKIDKNNKVRLIRAIERGASKGMNNEPLPYLENVGFTYIGLTAPREFLYRKADMWVEEIWNGGLIDEVRGLIDKGYENSPKIKGLVYKTARDFTLGSVAEEDAIQRIKFDMHAYIRRQETWFKKNKKVLWVDISQDDFKEIIYNKIEENI